MASAQSVHVVLASGSPARRELLKRAGYRFEIQPANIDEPTGENARDPRSFVQEVAWRKAAAVAPRVEDAIVVAADTVGWLEGQVIGKPADEADARRILRQLGGTTHELWTGVCLWRRPDDVQLQWQERSLVRFARLSDTELSDYLSTRQWEGCSGAYAILEKDDPYVHLLDGSWSNVVGLPMEALARNLPAICASR